MMEAKIAGMPVEAEEEIPALGNVVDIVAALRKSLAEAEGRGTRVPKGPPQPMKTPRKRAS